MSTLLLKKIQKRSEKLSFNARQSFWCPLLMLNHWQNNLLFYFVLWFSASKNEDQIENMAFEWTKMRPSIACQSLINSDNWAKLFKKHTFWLCSFSKLITYDRRAEFINMFWRQLYPYLEINSKLFTSYPLEMDWETKRLNTVVKQYFYLYLFN